MIGVLKVCRSRHFLWKGSGMKPPSELTRNFSSLLLSSSSPWTSSYRNSTRVAHDYYTGTYHYGRRNLSFHEFQLKCLGLFNSYPVVTLSNQLMNFHDWSGFPWWGTILVTTVTFRGIIMFPAHIMSQKTTAKRLLLDQEMKKLNPEISNKIADQGLEFGWSRERMITEFKGLHKAIHKDKIIENNCSLGKIYLPAFLQIPFWITLSMANRRIYLSSDISERILRFKNEGLVDHLKIPSHIIKKLSTEKADRIEQLANEGALWFSNLTLPDPYFILPVLTTLCFLMSIQISKRLETHDISKLPRYLQIFMKIRTWIPILFLPIMCILPSSLSLYWFANSMSGLTIILLLAQPRIRRILGIPMTHVEKQYPMKYLYNSFKTDLEKRMKKSSK